MNKKYFFGTGTMRCGSSLVISLLELSGKVQTFNEEVYFFRHIFKKLDKFNKKNFYYLSGLIHLIFKFRNNKIIEHEKIYNKIKNCKNYYDIYQSIISILNNQKKIVVEYSNGEWRNIKNFLNLNKKNKAFHVIRDPRAVLSSFKKISFGQNYDYLNCIFNWKDSYDSMISNKKKIKRSRYFIVKYEDLQSNPKKTVKNLCNFFGIKFSEKLISNKTFKNIKNKDLLFSSHSKYKIYGFDKKRIFNWTKNLEKWEIALVENLLKKEMQSLDYNILSKQNLNEFNIGLHKIKKNKILNIRLKNLIKSKKGTHLRMNNPEMPINWSSRKKPNKKFSKEKEYKFFLKNYHYLNSQIKKNSKNLKFLN